MGAWLSFWSERAERAERCAQHLADALELVMRRHDYVPNYREVHEALAEHRELLDRRARMLPTGPMADS